MTGPGGLTMQDVAATMASVRYKRFGHIDLSHEPSRTSYATTTLAGRAGRRFQSPVRMSAIRALRLINVKELEQSNTL